MKIKPWDSSTCDYSFMGLGGLYNTILASNMDACRRFGAENVHSIIGSALFAEKDTTPESLALEIEQNTNIRITRDDMEFLGKFVQARKLIEQATNLLKEGLK
ncbi:MAG: hypothetical protein OEL57_02225 [Trichlorobacter sp.]|uniref:hypothetical protein n=1 Tax=Trichlorobacter sp. TaxID=2911007 RepID=UPI002568C59A|nr:hypothetical protein [Trichlorobacter sp.]MDK9716707.1 hypothetical protein [Trichlorobacter sp.]